MVKDFSVILFVVLNLLLKIVYHRVRQVAEPAVHEVRRQLKHHGNESLKQRIHKLREKAMNEISRYSVLLIILELKIRKRCMDDA